jgi:hypothetical protein
MAGPTRSKAQREADLQTLASLYLAGHSQAVIARRLQVSQPQISLDLKKLYKFWRDSALIDFNEAKQRELHRIDVLEREAWRMHRRSLRVKTIQRESHSIGPLGSTDTDETVTEGGQNNPAWIKTVQWCIEQRCKILSIYAAEKMTVTEVPYDELANEFDRRIAGLANRSRADSDSGPMQPETESGTALHLEGMGAAEAENPAG